MFPGSQAMFPGSPEIFLKCQEMFPGSQAMFLGSQTMFPGSQVMLVGSQALFPEMLGDVSRMPENVSCMPGSVPRKSGNVS